MATARRHYFIFHIFFGMVSNASLVDHLHIVAKAVCKTRTTVGAPTRRPASLRRTGITTVIATVL